MNAQPHITPMHQDLERELARRLHRAQVEHTHAAVAIAGSRYHLVPVDDAIKTTDNPAGSYDPARALAALEAGAGAFKTMDVAAFLAEILEAWEQDTPGHIF